MTKKEVLLRDLKALQANRLTLTKELTSKSQDQGFVWVRRKKDELEELEKKIRKLERSLSQT